MPEVDPLDAVHAYIDALNRRDPDRIAGRVTENFFNEHTSRRRPDVNGRSNYRRRLEGFLAGFPELHYEIEDTVVEGDKVVVAYRLRALAVDPSGGEPHPIDVRGVFRFEVRDGLIAHRVDYFDGVTVEEQRGLRPAGGPPG